MPRQAKQYTRQEDMRHLRILRQIADGSSYSETGDLCGISRSAVSGVIGRIQKHDLAASSNESPAMIRAAYRRTHSHGHRYSDHMDHQFDWRRT